MVVAFDNSVLCLLLHPGVDVPNDPATGKPVSRAQDRIAYLVEQLRESRSRILIPTPVLAEFLTFASADYLEEINSSAHFQIAPFDQRAAIEAGSTMRKARLGPGGKKLGLDATLAEGQDRLADRFDCQGRRCCDHLYDRLRPRNDSRGVRPLDSACSRTRTSAAPYTVA